MKRIFTQLALLVYLFSSLSVLAQKTHFIRTRGLKKPQIQASFTSQAGILSGVNDACSGATNVTFEVPVADNNIGATQSLQAFSCQFGAPSNVANDVWFTFTYAANMDSLKVIPTANPNNNIVLELFEGACNNLNFLDCSDNAETNSDNQTEGFLLSSLGLSVGTQYRFRVYGFDGVECNFTVIIKSAIPPPPPANDACASPITLFATQAILSTSIGSTQSVAPITCNNATSGSAKDVWFRFTKNAFMDSLAVYPTGNTDFVVEVRTNNCAAGSTVICADRFFGGGSEKIPLSSLTNGTIYLARVYGFDGSAGEFFIKLKSAPANDNCINAITLSSNPTCTPLSGTTVDASQSLPAISCAGFSGSANDDVWYTFTIQSGMDTIRVTSVGFFDAVLDLRSGTCTNSSTIRCADATDLANATEKLFIGNLTIGTTYYLRVYGFAGTENSAGRFTICITESAQAGPPNDNCTNPEDIVAGVLVNGNSNGASQTAPNVACGGAGSSIMNDVWFRFTKTSAIDTVEVDGLGSLDVLFDVRQNSCPGGAAVACRDIPGSDLKKMSVSHLVNGTTYLLRVYGRNGARGAFTIRLTDDNVVVNPPANDECFDALSLNMGTTCTGTQGSNLAATETFPAGSCSGSNPGTARDVWYSFVANSTRAIARLTCNVGFDGAIQVYSGSCFGPSSIGCADALGASNDPDFPAVEEVFLNNLTSGQTYYLRVYGYNGGEGDFAVCVFNPNCNSTAATLITNTTTIVSNQAFTTQIGNIVGTVGYEFSNNQSNWFPIQNLFGPVDTLVGTSATGAPLYLRVVSRTGNCFPAYSPEVTMNIRCATPFTNASGQNRITRITFNTIDQTSTVNPLGGSVQDFGTITTTLCRGNSYPLGITVANPNAAMNRMAWIDFNQDGDFSDAGENVLQGTFVAGGTVSSNITIPANATIGSCRMRVAVINNGANVNSANPCAAGPYASGEIEEYSLNISAGLLANAGADQSVCGAVALLAGNDPGPGGSGIWSVVSGAATFANDNLFNSQVTGLGTGPNVLRWSLTNTCGTSQSEVTITSNRVISNAGTDATVCSTGTNLNASAPVLGTGVWSTLTGGANVTAPTVRNSAVLNLSIGLNQFIWTVTSPGPGCPQAKDTVSITRLAEPSNAVAGSDQNLCGTSTTLQATAPLVGTGVWSLVSGTGTFANNSLPNTQVNGLSAGANTFRWTVSNGVCPPKTDDVVINIITPPVAQAGQDQQVCTTSVNLSGNAPGTGVSGTWTLLSGAGQLANASSNTSGVNNLGLGANVLVWTLSQSGCTDGKDTVVITRKANPVASAGTDQAICQPSGNLAATNPATGTGLWTLVSGAGTIANASQSNSPISNLGFGANVFRWTVSDAPCAPATDEVTITNNLPGKPALGPDQNLCVPTANVNGGSVPPGLTANWVLISGSGTISNPSNPNTSIGNLGIGANAFAFVINVPACATSVSDTLVLSRESNPINLGKDTVVCQNFTPTYTLQGPANMSNYLWTGGSTGASLVVSTAGQYILSVNTPVGCNFKDTVNVGFTICGSVAGLKGTPYEIKVVPNPSQLQGFLEWKEPGLNIRKIEIQDATGRKIHEILYPARENSLQLNLPAGLETGIYFISIQADKGTQVLKWMVNK